MLLLERVSSDLQHPLCELRTPATGGLMLTIMPRLLGVIFTQAWSYSKRYPLDTWFYKTLVCIFLPMTFRVRSQDISF